MSYEDLRNHRRSVIETDVLVNDGSPYQGGMLHDISVSGVAVTYPGHVPQNSERIAEGDVLNLTIKGKLKMPARIVRTFDSGYAAKFDFSLPVRHW